MDTLCSIVKDINPYYIAGGAVAQYVFGMVWFSLLVGHIHRYYYAADKGVRRPEHAVQRYPKCVVALVTLLCAAARSVVVLTLVATFKAKTIEDYQRAAGATALITSVGVFKYFADQRPLQLIVTECGYEVVASMIAAVVPFYMKAAGI